MSAIRMAVAGLVQRSWPHGLLRRCFPAQLICRETTFTGPPLPLPFNSLVIELYRYRQQPRPASAKGHHKAVFRTQCVEAMAPQYPHEFPLTCGRTQAQNPGVVRMNHYWGMRANGFQPLKQSHWDMLEKDYSIKVRSALGVEHRCTVEGESAGCEFE